MSILWAFHTGWLEVKFLDPPVMNGSEGVIFASG